MKDKLLYNLSGQALVTLLVFVAVGLIVISGAVMVSILNTQGSAGLLGGEKALYLAENGAEEALIRLLRDPQFAASPQALSISGESIIVQVQTSGSTKTITSYCQSCKAKRKIQVITSYSDKLTINSWTEID